METIMTIIRSMVTQGGSTVVSEVEEIRVDVSSVARALVESLFAKVMTLSKELRFYEVMANSFQEIAISGFRERQGLTRDLRIAMEALSRAESDKEFYRGLLVDTASHLGEEIFIADDGTKMQDPLLLKIPSLVESLKSSTLQPVEVLKATNTTGNEPTSFTMETIKAGEGYIKEGYN